MDLRYLLGTVCHYVRVSPCTCVPVPADINPQVSFQQKLIELNSLKESRVNSIFSSPDQRALSLCYLFQSLLLYLLFLGAFHTHHHFINSNNHKCIQFLQLHFSFTVFAGKHQETLRIRSYTEKQRLL